MAASCASLFRKTIPLPAATQWGVAEKAALGLRPVYDEYIRQAALGEVMHNPLRIYIPDRYGMKQPKWIESIEAIDHWEPGYWVVRGWDREARMKATSVIDTIATNMMIAQPTREMRVPIGGIHAGIRGISKVELLVDNGEWMPAELCTPLSGQTWVVWRCDWPMQRGKHTFTVRCFEGDGTPQIAREAPPDPSGASGLETRSVML